MDTQAAGFASPSGLAIRTNNVAEYVALLEALQCSLALNAAGLHVYSDSQVVVKQIAGEYACRSPRLYSLHWICRKLARTIEFSITHVTRDFNLEANRLANSAARNSALSNDRRKLPETHTSLDAYLSRALEIGTQTAGKPSNQQ
jgi:ribonuclease HI